MINLNNITLVSVSSIKIDRIIKILNFCSQKIKFADIKFITDKEVINNNNNIKIIKCDIIDNIDKYSKYIVYDLHKHIETDFALIVQEDGFIINPESWKNEFLQYDYIGAPWPIPTDNFSYKDPFNNIIRVGNGGFSLRSKKLLSLPSQLNLPWIPYHGFYNEDGFFCIHNKHIFEQYGCKFADIDIAKYFSHEVQIPEINGITPFGFHGKNYNYNYLV